MTRILAILCAALALALYSLHTAYGSKSAALGAAQEKQQQTAARADSLTETLRLQRALAAEAAVIDARHTKELTDAQAENNRLRAALAAGEQRLRVNATCPRAPDTTGAARVADAGTPELTPQARQDYLALRDELALSRQMILGLQDYARLCIDSHITNPRNTP